MALILHRTKGDRILAFYMAELERESKLAEEHSKSAEALRVLIASREKILASTDASMEMNHSIGDSASVVAEVKQPDKPPLGADTAPVPFLSPDFYKPDSADEPVGRGELVLKIIAESGSGGATPKEIKQGAIDRGMKPLPKNFPYTSIWKLKEAKKIELADGGRYVIRQETISKDDW